MCFLTLREVHTPGQYVHLVSWPAAEVEIDETLIGHLLEDQHPDLAGMPLEEVGFGFDNSLWRLGPDLLLRLPRRLMGARLVEHEQRWLPVLAPGLPIKVPVPVRAGFPSSRFPWRWSVVPWLEGTPADLGVVTDELNAGVQLGGFLKALHHKAPEDAPVNPWRGVLLADRTDTFEQRLATVSEYVDQPALRRVWNEALASSRSPEAPVWIHGDLHPGNILLAGGRISAVLDFGDLCAGDPATDLAGAWLMFEAPGRKALLSAYGTPDLGVLMRAAGWAALFGLMLLELGLERRPSYEAVGRAGLHRLTQNH